MQKHLIITVVTIMLCQSVLYGCSLEKESAWTPPAFDTLKCSDYANHQTNMGTLNNNVWNKRAAEKKAWKQCLIKKQENGKTIYGWFWDWPGNKRVIYAYPQIKLGSSPWAPTPALRQPFPLKMSSLTKLTVTHHLETETNGTHNTATSLWLTDSFYAEIEPNPSIISAEIMIWTFSTPGHFSPAGKKVSEINIENNTWEVWHQNNWEDLSGANDNQWTIVTFKAKKDIQVAKLNVLAMLQYAQNQHLIADNLFVADIELGNEVMSGSGVTWVQTFEADIQTEF
jgi:hypothetical protein